MKKYITPNGEYKLNRPIEVKCNKCGLVSTPKYQMEIVVGENAKKFPQNSGKYVYSDGSITLCDECMAKGWTDDPAEIRKAILEDPILSKVISHESPYFKKED